MDVFTEQNFENVQENSRRMMTDLTNAVYSAFDVYERSMAKNN